jgi:ABC-2 type transport system permease protein
VRTRQALALARRSVVGTLRQPQSYLPSFFFPLLFAALSTASFGRSTALPGFPKVHSFLDFAVATTIVQGIIFGGTLGGNDMAVDIEDGFFDRLVASPVARSSILIGRLAGSAVIAGVQTVLFTAVLLAFGARIQGGVGAFVAILVIGMLLAVGVGGLGVTLALRTGSAEAVQASFPVFFISLFVSSAFFPRQLMHGWFKAVATANPLSWLVEGLRHLVITGFAFKPLLQSLAVVLALVGLSLLGASMALRRRLIAA